MNDSPSSTDALTGGARILVVDDDPLAREVLVALLEEAGAAAVPVAADGREALAEIERQLPDLILLDVVMDGMGGLELCRILRKTFPAARTLPIVITTGLEDGDRRAKALRAGASGFLKKPIRRDALVECLRIHLDEARLLSRLEGRGAPTPNDLCRARRLQGCAVPSPGRLRACTESSGLSLRHHSLASETLGGDCWTAVPRADGTLLLALADFSGHGLRAAVQASRFRTCAEMLDDGRNSPAELLHALNTVFQPMLPPGEYAACFAAVIDPAKRRVTYAMAGFPPPLIVAGSAVRVLDGPGDVLGAWPDPKYEDRTVSYPAGATLLAYSDGLVEPNDAGDAVFNPESLLDLAKKTPAVHDAILMAINASSHKFDDDLTVVSVESAA